MRHPVQIAVSLAAASTALAVADMGHAQDSGDVEMLCVSALAEQAKVDMADIESKGSGQAGEGTEVNLSLKGAPWKCYVNDSGEVTMLEFQGEG